MPLDSATFQLTWQAVPDADAVRAGLSGEPEAREPSRSDNPQSLTALRKPACLPHPGLVYPIRYQIARRCGQRAAGDAAELRDLQMPERIFLVGKRVSPVVSKARRGLGVAASMNPVFAQLLGESAFIIREETRSIMLDLQAMLNHLRYAWSLERSSSMDAGVPGGRAMQCDGALVLQDNYGGELLFHADFLWSPFLQPNRRDRSCLLT
ncbi:hypothetical protein ACTMU2_07745 [Cupriavidus basilensis]